MIGEGVRKTSQGWFQRLWPELLKNRIVIQGNGQDCGEDRFGGNHGICEIWFGTHDNSNVCQTSKFSIAKMLNKYLYQITTAIITNFHRLFLTQNHTHVLSHSFNGAEVQTQCSSAGSYLLGFIRPKSRSQQTGLPSVLEALGNNPLPILFKLFAELNSLWLWHWGHHFPAGRKVRAILSS